jgi:hypothetical protein
MDAGRSVRSRAESVSAQLLPADASQLTEADIYTIVENVRDDVMRIRGVVGLGVGRQDDESDPIHHFVLEVYLTDERARTKVPDRVLSRLAGVPVRYVVTGTVQTA